MQVHVRIGMAAGEPVTERNDLFGATVQLAARLCSRADPGGILVAGAVHDLALGKGFAFRSRGRLRLKGFDSPMSAFEVVWQTRIVMIDSVQRARTEVPRSADYVYRGLA